MALLLGIDVGTTSVKVGVFNTQGQCLGIVRQDYSLQVPAVDQVELDAEIYWETTCVAIQQLLTSHQIVEKRSLRSASQAKARRLSRWIMPEIPFITPLYGWIIGPAARPNP